MIHRMAKNENERAHEERRLAGHRFQSQDMEYKKPFDQLYDPHKKGSGCY